MKWRKLLFFLFYIIHSILWADMALAQKSCPIPVAEATYGAVKKFGQSLAAGATQVLCEDISKKQLAQLNCSMKSGQLNNLSDTMRQVQTSTAVEAVFQDIAGVSHKQAACRLRFLDKYKADSTTRKGLENSVEEAFNKILQDVRGLLEDKKRLEQDLADYENVQGKYANDQSAARGQDNSGVRQNAITDKKKGIENKQSELVKLLLSVPMGYDPDVSQALIAMAEKNQFSRLDFYNSILLAEGKYLETEKYYRDKMIHLKDENGNPRITYCLGLEYRNSAGKSGELRRYVKDLPEKNSEQSELKQNLKCHMEKYASGQDRFETGVTVLAFGTLFFPPASAGGAATAGVSALTKASAIARSAVLGVAAVDMVMALDSLRESCMPAEAFISSDINECDPEKEFQRTIQEPKLSMCAVGAVLGAGVAFQAVNKVSSIYKKELPVSELKSETALGEEASTKIYAKDKAVVSIKPKKVKKDEPYVDIKIDETERNLANRNIEFLEDPQIQKVAKDVYERLGDSKAWDDYIKKLQDDTREQMLKSSDSKVRAMAKNGELTRTEMLKVLVQRAKGRGDEIGIVKNLDGEELRTVAKEKAFFDKILKGSDHSMIGHFIQRDMVSPVIPKNLKKKFWNDIIETKNPRSYGEERVWDTIFDNLANNPTGPEFVIKGLAPHLPVSGF